MKVKRREEGKDCFLTSTCESIPLKECAKANSIQIPFFPTIRLLSILFHAARQSQEVSATSTGCHFWGFLNVQGKITESDPKQTPKILLFVSNWTPGASWRSVWEQTNKKQLPHQCSLSKDKNMTMRKNLHWCPFCFHEL